MWTASAEWNRTCVCRRNDKAAPKGAFTRLLLYCTTPMSTYSGPAFSLAFCLSSFPVLIATISTRSVRSLKIMPLTCAHDFCSFLWCQPNTGGCCNPSTYLAGSTLQGFWGLPNLCGVVSTRGSIGFAIGSENHCENNFVMRISGSQLGSSPYVPHLHLALTRMVAASRHNHRAVWTESDTINSRASCTSGSPTSLCVATSHIFTVLSSLAVAISRLSRLIATHSTRSSCSNSGPIGVPS